jgi:acyl-CoA synthetase (AMP-forming)/AMP-acid ligase II
MPEARLPDAVQTIPAALDFWAGLTPEAPALRAIEGGAASFGAVRDAVAGVAGRLTALGVEPGERVALVLAPGLEASLALLGVMSAVVAVPFNPAATESELRRDLERLPTRLLVWDGSPGAASAAVAASLGIPTMPLDALITSEQGRPRTGAGRSAVGPESIAAILHTSGTTGLPKRVPRPHRTFVAGARAARICSDLTPDDVLLLTAPLYANAGLVNLCAALCSGGSCLVTPGSDPAAYPGWLEAHGATWTVTNATELNLVLAEAAAAGRATLAGPRSRLRLVRAGAQPMTPGTAERAEASLRALVFDGFGMTEASYITGSGPGAGDRRPGSCGPPLNSEIRVLDDRGEELPARATGEIVIRGETLFPGYLDDAEANAAAFLPGGWFRTGDVGCVDEDGHLYLSGRRNELINRGGEKIAPVEVDRALQSHRAVAEAATFAVPDARLGEDIVAAVVLRSGAALPAWELRGWLLERLTPYKVPRRIWFVDCLPRTATGKVQRGVLAEWFVANAKLGSG